MASTKVTLFLKSTKTLVLTGNSSVKEITTNLSKSFRELKESRSDFSRSFAFLTFDDKEVVALKMSELDAVLITDTNTHTPNLRDLPDPIQPIDKKIQEQEFSKPEKQEPKVIAKSKPGPKPKKLNENKDTINVLDLIDESSSLGSKKKVENPLAQEEDTMDPTDIKITPDTFKLEEDYDPNELDIDEDMEAQLQAAGTSRQMMNEGFRSSSSNFEEEVKMAAQQELSKAGPDVVKGMSLEEMIKNKKGIVG